ncbi:dockerin type I domain-containing protein, partial [Ruminococcus sp.]|uniref:dockerin type I domain-containing protein n=1 Tax=Ruminococcus sp. TaxID=41978 RepID=UPI001B4C83B3
TTTTTTTTEPVTTTTTTTAPQLTVTKAGDVNCDDTIDMADAVLIMQSLANPNKYGVGGTDSNALTEQGKVNADTDGDGLTTNDALRIQEFLLGIVKSL